MTTHRTQPMKDCIYFITFTCHNWIPLIELSGSYNNFYKWFNYLIQNYCRVNGYVIMPNHFHGLIYVDRESPKTINQIMANGKRFLAYGIVDNLKKLGKDDLLLKLQKAVSEKEKEKQKKHHVFIPSFDAKKCFSKKMIETKLNYIHRNPIQQQWKLVKEYTDYEHSSAAFYELDSENQYVTHYLETIYG